MNIKLLPASLCLLGLWFVLTDAKREPNNPPTGKTGAPGEQTCGQSDCHTGGNQIGTVTISGVPDTVVTNQTYAITLTNMSNAIRAGFEMTCLDATNAMCGTFTAPNGSGVSIGNGASGKKYPRQSSPRTLSNGMTSWTFNWKAPSLASGNIATFYFVSLCANNDGEKTGDKVLISNKTVVLGATTAATEPAEELANVFPTIIRTGLLHIELNSPENSRVFIFDMAGKPVLQHSLSGQTSDLNVSQLPKGGYFAQIYAASGRSSTKRFVIE